MNQYDIRAVVFKEDETWVAQCLEYDIGAQGSDEDDLKARLILTIEAERQESVSRSGAPFAGIAPAPWPFVT